MQEDRKLMLLQLAANFGSSSVWSMVLARMATSRTLRQKVGIGRMCFSIRWDCYASSHRAGAYILLQSDDTRYIPRAIMIDLEPRV